MSIKVALLAFLALFAGINAQTNVALVAQSSLSCGSDGCSILQVLVSNTLSVLNGANIDFSVYSGITINFDNPLLSGFTIANLSVSGSNVINVVNGASVKAQTLVVGAGSTLNVAASGTLTSNAVQVDNNVQAAGAIVIGAGSSIKVATGGLAGVIYQNAANLTVSAGASVDASIQVASGAAAQIGQQASSAATAAQVSGTIVVNGAANFGNAVVAGAVTVGSSATASAAANIAVTVSATATFQSTFTASAQSTVTVNAGAALIAAGQVQSQGSVVVSGAINTTTATANYVQQASSTASASVASNLQLSGGSVNVGASADIQIDGSLSGQGTLNGDLTGSGAINVGNSPGTVFVNGDYKPGVAQTFNLEVASIASFDKLAVSGTAELNGFLNCILINGYNPNDNDRFTFITANRVTGQYIGVRGSGSNLAKWSQSATANTVIANYNSAVTVAVSGLLVVACLLASLL